MSSISGNRSPISQVSVGPVGPTPRPPLGPPSSPLLPPQKQTGSSTNFSDYPTTEQIKDNIDQHLSGNIKDFNAIRKEYISDDRSISKDEQTVTNKKAIVKEFQSNIESSKKWAPRWQGVAKFFALLALGAISLGAIAALCIFAPPIGGALVAAIITKAATILATGLAGVSVLSFFLSMGARSASKSNEQYIKRMGPEVDKEQATIDEGEFLIDRAKANQAQRKTNMAQLNDASQKIIDYNRKSLDGIKKLYKESVSAEKDGDLRKQIKGAQKEFNIFYKQQMARLEKAQSMLAKGDWILKDKS